MTQPSAPDPASDGRRGATQQSVVAPSPAVSIVVPTYNERERLEEFVRTVVHVLGVLPPNSSSSMTTPRTEPGSSRTAWRANFRSGSCTGRASSASAAP